ncbi:MAG: hypothetical protein AABY13_02380 [Nanoarchaeota archaeon]
MGLRNVCRRVIGTSVPWHVARHTPFDAIVVDFKDRERTAILRG